jgi:hypothetical protein
VVRHIFQACPVWIYTQSNITQASYSPEYITPTQQISYIYIMSKFHHNLSQANRTSLLPMLEML